MGEAPLAIVAPGGQQTSLSLDDKCHLLSGITNPAGETNSFTYDEPCEGLMASSADPRRQLHTFTYDDYGMLATDSDPAGGSTSLQRVGDDPDYTVVATTGEGR